MLSFLPSKSSQYDSFKLDWDFAWSSACVCIDIVVASAIICMKNSMILCDQINLIKYLSDVTEHYFSLWLYAIQIKFRRWLLHFIYISQEISIKNCGCCCCCHPTHFNVGFFRYISNHMFDVHYFHFARILSGVKVDNNHDLIGENQTNIWIYYGECVYYIYMQT